MGGKKSDFESVKKKDNKVHFRYLNPFLFLRNQNFKIFLCWQD